MMSYTERMEDALFQQWDVLDDYNEDYQSLITALNSEGFFRTFGDGLLFFLGQKNPGLKEESAIAYIRECCAAVEVSQSEIGSINTLKSWFSGGPRPKKGEESRYSMFALAFALQLTPLETADLFHKVYLDRAFDYRNEKEIIFYFCLQHNKSWSEAKRIIDRCRDMSFTEEDHTVYTYQLKTEIDSLSDEAALMNYIAGHGRNLHKKNVRAIEHVRVLLREANKLAKEEAVDRYRIEKKENASSRAGINDRTALVETPIYKERFAGSNKDSNNFTYEVITELSVNGARGTRTLFKNARLPIEIKRRFPEAATLSKKDPTYEELRKLIILLASYNFWYHVRANNMQITMDEYVDEINMFLDESGFSPLYPGNPYDWLFLFCTLGESPLDTFREILADVLWSE